MNIIPKDVIEKAIEGGWKVDEERPRFIFGDEVTTSMGLKCPQSTIALDPTFWQCLGKALGWKTTQHCSGECNDFIDDDGKTIDGWEFNAKEFYDLVLTNGDTDAFWKELLANK